MQSDRINEWIYLYDKIFVLKQMMISICIFTNWNFDEKCNPDTFIQSNLRILSRLFPTSSLEQN